MISLKKFIAVIIIVALLLTSVSQGLFVFAGNDIQNNEIKSFVEDLSQMIRKNEINNSAGADSFLGDYWGSSNGILGGFVPDTLLYENMASDAFQTCRLIVKSKSAINYMGAIDCVSGYNDLYVLQYGNELSAKMAYEYYIKCDFVEFVEPDSIYVAAIDETSASQLTDNEPTYFDEFTAAAMEWLSDKIGFSDIKEKLAEKIEDDYVLVAVIDSGVDTDHELLADRLVESSVNLSTTGQPNSVEDDYGHGTHVAGIIANYTLNNVMIKPYKVLNDVGNGSLSSIAVAVDMAVKDGADIINISISGKEESKMLTEAIDNAVANDVNVVVAAGNRKADLDEVYISPACVESAITVSATDTKDNLADFSNYDGTIDIAAPGTDIKSSYLDNKYVSMSGTSMAAPQVAAGIALVRSIHLDESAKVYEETIKDYAINKFEKEGENHYGAGLLYLKYLLDGKPTVAAPVFSVDSCSFNEPFSLNIECADKDATIYYIMYNTSLENVNWFESFKYTKPITISFDTKISAIAYADGKKTSSIVTVEYDRVGETEEDYYDINVFGYITGYYGDLVDLVIPNQIKDKEVKGVAIGAFEDNNKIQTVQLPDTCETINPSAFKNCSSLVSVSGEGVETVSSYAFENSSVEFVDFPNLKTINTYSFAECSNLQTISIPNVESIGNYAFTQSGITSIDMPNLMLIGTNVFLDCYSLVSVSAPKLQILSISTFKNCTSLKNVDMNELVDIGANSFRNTALEDFYGQSVLKVGNYAFADNIYLEKVYLPKTVETGTYVFFNCTSLRIIGLPSLEELNASMFSNCTSLLNLYLPNATNVVKGAFKDSSIELLKFEKIETINSLPDTLRALVVPSSLESITVSSPESDYTVYGYQESYANQFATKNNKNFEPIPCVYEESSKQVSANERFIVVYAIGYNCTYQWYRNDTISNVGGTLIEDAVHFFYEPSAEDNCAAYYCVVTSNDGIYISTVTTAPIVNAPEYRDADYTEYNKIVEEINAIDRTLYNDEYLSKLDALLEIDISGLKLAQQDEVDLLVNQLSVTLELVKNSFIMGDINGDQTISAIDVRFVLKYVVDMQQFDNRQMASADMDGDGKITAVDARMIMIKALEL